MAARPEYEENGVHCSAIINPLAVRTQRVLSFMLRDEWSHFLPESITDLPLVARHTSPSEIIILYYLTIPFGIGSKPEQYIHYLITNVSLDGLGGEYLEIIEAARDIRVELDAHNYISNILTKLGIDRPSGLTRVMDLASRHPEWHQYVSEVTDWLQPVVSDLMERLPENDTVDIT